MLGVPLDACVAVGDSRSDLPLFEEVGYSIAFNGTPEARGAATAAVDGDDLRAVLPLLERWLTSPAGR
ncbi:HAD hydrolase family protein [Streptomyces niveus]|uniref:HAD hydrolase family protein n=1 Tax=Streptomyces niveus TaxID=193462 RepID=UPI003865C0F6